MPRAEIGTNIKQGLGIARYLANLRIELAYTLFRISAEFYLSNPLDWILLVSEILRLSFGWEMLNNV